MMNSGRTKRGWRLACLSAVSGAALLAWVPVSHGERVVMGRQQVWFDGQWEGGWGRPMMMPIQVGISEDQRQLIDGFTVASSGVSLQDTPAGAAIQSMQAGDWLKAIEAIESLSNADQRLVMDGDGVLRPLATLKSSLIASMPEEGRRTFRRLNNPAAQTLLAEALEQADPAERERALTALVNDYALCDASAKAADTLGDIRFEQGRFDEAASLYRFSAEHPEATGLPMLMAKRLIALSRAGLWNRFDALAEDARFRMGGSSVTLGGSAVRIDGLIKQLVSTREATDAPPRTHDGTLAMPTGKPIFEKPIADVSPYQLKSLRMAAAQQNMAGVIDKLVAPVVTSDDGRLFTLGLGSVARLDPQTGSDLWRQGDATAHLTALHQRMYQLQQGYEQALVIAGQTLLAVVPHEQYPNRANLLAYDAETGKELWDWRKVSREHRNMGVIGRPLVVEDRVYIVAQQPQQTQAKLLVLTLANGTLVSQMDLGTAPQEQNLNSPADLSPRLAMGEGYLFVQTNNGALIAVDPSDMRVAWALTQRIRPSGMGLIRQNGVFVPELFAKQTGTVFTRDGIVYAKDTRGDTVHAFREFDAAPLWKAQTDPDATIVHVDDRHVYVLGGKVDSDDGLSNKAQRLVALDLHTGKPVWGSRHAGAESGLPVFTDDACLIAGSNNLCRIDLATGKLTAYRSDLAGAATLSVIGNQLIAAMHDEVRALPLPQAQANQP